MDKNVRSLFITAADGAGNDTIFGNAGDDFIFGQQGADLIEGNEGDDDIIGGHNVLHGVDGNDTIHGNEGADVILGDNGEITRRLLEGHDDQWEKYPAPFADVIRSLQRFDDIDFVQGDDELHGDAGEDIIHGQRGNDLILGGDNDDELIGDLGDDSIQGNAGNDVLIADVGYVVRDFNKDGSPRTNNNGSWHRDVFLEEVATISGRIDMDRTPLRNLDPELAAKLIESDMLLLTGEFNSQGNKVNNQDNGAWNTDVLLLDVVPSNNDNLQGGDGDDIIFGQRGNDILNGGNQDDLIFGDGAVNQMPFKTELPHVFNGVRIIGLEAAVAGQFQLGEFGSVVAPAIHVLPEELQLNDPFNLPNLWGNVVSDTQVEFDNLLDIGSLQNASGNEVRPFASVITDVVHHKDMLPGGDQIDGAAGDDLIVGDTGSVYSPLLPGIQSVVDAHQGVRDSFDLAMHTAGSLTLDLEYLQHSLQGESDPYTLVLANDNIVGGSGTDIIIGDDGLILGSFIAGPPVSAGDLENVSLDLFNYLKDAERIAIDFEHVLFEAHFQTLSTLIANSPGPITNQATPDLHRLVIGNDTLAGGNDGDLLVGDHGTIVTGFATNAQFDLLQSNSGIPAAAWSSVTTQLNNQLAVRNSQLNSHVTANHNQANRNFTAGQLAMIPWDFEHRISIGNDGIVGEAGDDLIVGDFGQFSFLALAKTPVGSTEISNRQQDINKLTTDVAHFLEANHHQLDYDALESLYRHVSFGQRGGAAQEIAVIMGNDTLSGGSGDDYILGDSDSVSVTQLYETPSIRFDEPDPDFRVEYQDRSAFELHEHYSRTAPSTLIGKDILLGEEDNDYLLGQYQDDTVLGGPGNDIVFGGSGNNTVSDTVGTND
ncbi:MAG: hypothetical protein KDA87_24500, partial [Planctomycetales bacterium]|nr:hypothetical protein [Planctomycetales bacterium]